MYSKVNASSINQIDQLPSRTHNEIEDMKGKLNSQRIELIFGSYGVEVVLQENNIRVSNLHSNGVMRTFAVVNYSLPVPDWFQNTHDKIYQGGSIGQTIKNDGFSLIKEDVYFGLTKLPEFAKEKMQTDKKSVAVYIYRLIVKNQENSESIDYCTVTEIYSPLYLTLGDLQLLSPEGTQKHQVISESVQKYLDDISALDQLLMPENHGVKAFNEGNYEKAKELFLRAIDKKQETPESYFYLGKCHFFCDEKQQAISPLKTYIKKINKLIEVKQNNSDDVANLSYAFDVLGQCYEAENKGTAALTCYETATKIYLSCASAWNNMGLFYIKSAKSYLEKEDLMNAVNFFGRALVFIKKALELCSDNPVFLHGVASWYEQYIEVLEKVIGDDEAVQKKMTNNFSHALQYYLKALNACKEDDFVLKNIILGNYIECLAQYGHHMYKNEHYKEAQETYLKVIQFDPDHLPAINQMGMTLFKQNCFSEARKYFSSILEKTKDKQEIADAWLNIACTYRFEKEWYKAQEALNQAKTFSPEDSSITDEEKKLNESKAAAILISTPQILFGNSNSTAQGIENKPSQDTSFQFH
ncbi:photosystem I assembly protein Ycf3 [Legionella steigerwaltii]|uniref:Photosystem I assembly protein Ycf3 n=1 Tax=Legionella steigerwaltii TaxID=460 RepID=A0A378L8Z2_9GAMM|nr:tetratricopeptide repeat protein [Legionella steigerwaltii]KTD81117.1 photosystem I assembly protein Ycf3 [Legionella steigerwaltii]STY23194.1 photosystem I assembly protein Ycf3 [Legionella steigerwaltii]